MLGVLIMEFFKRKCYELISGYESIRVLERSEICSINIVLEVLVLDFY